MRNDQAAMVSRLVREQEAMESRREAEARTTAHGLIQGYIGPDHKVIDMPNFYSALVQAIRTARWQGQTDGPDEDVLTLRLNGLMRQQGARASAGAPLSCQMRG
jgi:hypothetical protein